MQCCWLGLCCQGVCTPGKWGHVGWVAVAPRDPSPAGWEAFGCQHLLCSWVGVVVLVRTNQSGKWAVAGMWEILRVAFSTCSQALQANPSLSMPIGMASPRAAGEQGHVPALQPLQQGSPAQAAVVSSAVCPHVPPCGQGWPYQPITAPPPAMLCLPSHLPSSWGVQCSQLSVIAQCPSRQSMGEDVLMVAWVRCVLAACTPRGSDGISALIHSPPSSPSHQGDVDLSPCGCPC